jgi:transcriptional regulator with XRE-family HTH domain
VTESNTLGEYLRARRELTDPRAVGLRVAGVRRTPGLRREEVATLAGVSADYYLRLEQGRDRHPSPQVLTALAGVFGLDPAAASYLLSLAAPRPARAAARRPRREAVPAGLQALLQALTLPAFVESRSFDVLAANPVVTALQPAIRAGENRLRSVFLDPAERDLYPDWHKVVVDLVASFRVSIGTDTDDPGVVQLVGELSLGSEEFRRLWARHDVRPIGGGAFRLRHPEHGDLELRREKLPLGDTNGQILAVYYAEPGSAAAGVLARLAAGQGGEPVEPYPAGVSGPEGAPAAAGRRSRSAPARTPPRR